MLYILILLFQINKTIKDSFKKNLRLELFKLSPAGPVGPPFGTEKGKQWHTLIDDYVEGKRNDGGKAVDSLFKNLDGILGIKILSSKFTLHGYTRSASKNESSTEVNFWDGEADAIGFYYNEERSEHEYVIIEWKTMQSLLDFWESRDTLGHHLHQGLAYAKLLQVHLELSYLPSVLLVGISTHNGSDVQSGLFWDYPDRCKEVINDHFRWSTEQPEPLSLRMYGNKSRLFIPQKVKSSQNGDPLSLPADTRLRDIFNEDATIGDLTKALGSDIGSLTVISDPNLKKNDAHLNPTGKQVDEPRQELPSLCERSSPAENVKEEDVADEKSQSS